MFGNPVPGSILPKGAAWPGAPQFIVTATFAEHVASGRGPGLDIGDGREGEPVLAAEAGRIVQAFLDPGNRAVIVRIDHPQLAAGGKKVVTGYAHLRSIEVGLVAVARGQVIGHVGSTGAPGQPHLHFGVNIGGVEVDGWPLLDQNIVAAGGHDMIEGTNPVRIVNRHTTVIATPTARFRAAPAVGTTPTLASLPPGSPFIPDFSVTGQDVGGSTAWFAGFLPVGGKQTLGYLHSSVVGPLESTESSGHTDKELADAVKAGQHEAATKVAQAAEISASQFP